MSAPTVAEIAAALNLLHRVAVADAISHDPTCKSDDCYVLALLDRLPAEGVIVMAETLTAALHNEVMGCKFTEADEYYACTDPGYHKAQAAALLRELTGGGPVTPDALAGPIEGPITDANGDELERGAPDGVPGDAS